MNRAEIYDKLNEVFCDIFDSESISIQDSTTAADIDEWDSLTHIALMAEVEEVFDVKFSMKDIVQFKNVGEMVDVIASQL